MRKEGKKKEKEGQETKPGQPVFFLYQFGGIKTTPSITSSLAYCESGILSLTPHLGKTEADRRPALCLFVLLQQNVPLGCLQCFVFRCLVMFD